MGLGRWSRGFRGSFDLIFNPKALRNASKHRAIICGRQLQWQDVKRRQWLWRLIGDRRIHLFARGRRCYEAASGNKRLRALGRGH